MNTEQNDVISENQDVIVNDGSPQIIPGGENDVLSELSQFIGNKEEFKPKEVTPVNNPVSQVDPVEEVEKEEVKEEVKEVVKEEKKSVFGFNKKDKKTDVSIESPDQIFGYLKTKFGQEVSDTKSLQKFLDNSVTKWRTDSQNLEKVESEKAQYQEILENLPENFISAIQTYYNGGDYTSVLNDKPKIDYSVDVNKHSTKDLVNAYFPGKFNDEDFNEEEPSTALEIAISSSKDKYSIEKQQRERQRAEVSERSKAQLESYRNSVSGSVNSLKNTFPDVAEDAFEEVKGALEGGVNSVLSWFFNNDGTVKSEAAERLMMAKYGKEEIERMIDSAATKTETRINEEIVTRGADGPKPKKGSGQYETIPQDVSNVIKGLESISSKKTF